MDELDANASAYLEGRGIPAWLLSAAQKVGPEGMLPVSAVKMADLGAVTQLLEGDQGVSVDRAKWLDVMDDITRERLPAELIALFEVIYEAKPELALEYGSRLWNAAVTGHKDGVRTIAHDLVSRMTTLAFPAASDAAVNELIRVELAESQPIRAAQRWDICSDFFAGKGFGTFLPSSKMAAMEFSADAALVRTAAHRNWRPVVVPAWADAAGKELAVRTAQAMLLQGEDIRLLSSDPRISCDWSANLMQAIARTPPREAAALYRWLSSQN
jgi:hypothetical protein